MTGSSFSSILFDLDGTLVDTAPDLVATLNHLMGLDGLSAVSLDDVRDSVGLGARAILTTGYGLHGRQLSDGMMDRAQQAFLDHYRANICVESRLFDGVKDTLDALSRQGITLGVCTNKTESLSVALLDYLGLSPYFAAICGADTVPRRKPHPDHILTALERAGATSGRALMVGDARADIEAAKAAGVASIALSYGYSTEPIEALGADLILDDFAAIPDHLHHPALSNSSFLYL